MSNTVDYFQALESHAGSLNTLRGGWGNDWDLWPAALAERTAQTHRAIERLRTAEALAAIVHATDTSFWAPRQSQLEAALVDYFKYFEHGWGDGGVGLGYVINNKKVWADNVATTVDQVTTAAPGQRAWTRAKLSALELADGVSGNDALRLSGRFTLATGSFSIDPLTHGAQVEVRNALGLPRLSAMLPGGAYTKPGPGWVRSGNGKRFTFRNGTPGGSGGISKLVVADKGGGVVQVTISGTRATLALVPTDAPPQVTVVLGDSTAGTAGECGEVTLAPGQCSTDATTIVCR